MHPIIQLGDYAGTVVFAISGGLAAAQKRLDITGFVLLALVTAVGGGTMRDVLLARGEVFWIREPLYLVLGAVPGVLVFFLADRLRTIEPTIVWADAAGLAVFAVIGADIVLERGAAPLLAILMGVLTATGGGVLRDVLCDRLPLFLHREFYVVAALAGSATMVALARGMDAPQWVAVAGGLVAGFAARAAGIIWHLHLPVFSPRQQWRQR